MHRTKVKVATDALDANDHDRRRQPRTTSIARA